MPTPLPYRVVLTGFNDLRSPEARQRNDALPRPFSAPMLMQELSNGWTTSPMVVEPLEVQVALLDYQVTEGGGRTRDGGSHLLSMRLRFDARRPTVPGQRPAVLAPVELNCSALQQDAGPDFESRMRRNADYVGNAWDRRDPTLLGTQGTTGRMWDSLFRQCASRLNREFTTLLLRPGAFNGVPSALPQATGGFVEALPALPAPETRPAVHARPLSPSKSSQPRRP